MDNEQKPSQALVEPLMAEAQRVEEDSTHTSKSHFEAAVLWDKRHLWLGVPVTILTAVVGASVLSEEKIHGLFQESGKAELVSLITGLLAVLAAILSALGTFLKPNERAAQHLASGNAYNSLKNDARIFREIVCKEGKSEPELLDALKELNKRRSELNASSPQPPPKARKQALKGIQAGEARYQADRPKRIPKQS